MKKKTKIILSVVFALWFIILIGASGNSSDTPQTKQNEDIPLTEESQAEDTEAVPHREGIYGVSGKDIESLGIDSQFTVSDVINDVTGNWKIFELAVEKDRKIRDSATRCSITQNNIDNW